MSKVAALPAGMPVGLVFASVVAPVSVTVCARPAACTQAVYLPYGYAGFGR
jgi:hypothetical protein